MGIYDKKILYDFEIPKKYTFIRIGTAGTFIGILSVILFSNRDYFLTSQ